MKVFKRAFAFLLIFMILAVLISCENDREVVAEYDVSMNQDGSIISTLYSDGVLEFKGSGKIKNYQIPLFSDSMTNMNESKDISPWYANENVKSVVFSDDITSIGSSLLADCVNVKEISLPENCQYIFMNAFKNCNKLTKVTIPGKVFYVDSWAFDGCIKINDIEFDNRDGWFIDKNESEEIDVTNTNAIVELFLNNKYVFRSLYRQEFWENDNYKYVYGDNVIVG